MNEVGGGQLVSFTCPRCERTSWHPDDARHGYCGACHDFTGDPDAGERATYFAQVQHLRAELRRLRP